MYIFYSSNNTVATIMLGNRHPVYVQYNLLKEKCRKEESGTFFLDACVMCDSTRVAYSYTLVTQ